MLPITTKRHPFRFYGILIIYLLFIIGICFIMLNIYNENKSKPENADRSVYIPVIIILFLATVIYLIYVYFRNSPMMILDEIGISFKKKHYTWKEVKKVKLSGKQAFPMLLYFPMECITLHFYDDNTLLIFDELYKDSQKIKEILQVKINGEALPLIEKISPIEKSEADNDFYKTYRGNQLTNFRGITLWFFVGFGFYNFIAGNFFNKPAIIVYSLVSILIFLSFSWMIHYFRIGNKFMIIKNHNLLWIHKLYKLEFIEEVIFETQGKLPNCMRIITKDFKRSRLFPAGTLRDKTWLAMKVDLENKGIKVRNECV